MLDSDDAIAAVLNERCDEPLPCPTYALLERRGEVFDSPLCPGVIVSGAYVRRSILSNRAFVDEGARVEESILFSGARVGCGARKLTGRPFSAFPMRCSGYSGDGVPSSVASSTFLREQGDDAGIY